MSKLFRVHGQLEDDDGIGGVGAASDPELVLDP